MGGGGFGVSIFFLAGSVPGGGGGSGALACRKRGMPIYPIFLLTRY